MNELDVELLEMLGVASIEQIIALSTPRKQWLVAFLTAPIELQIDLPD